MCRTERRLLPSGSAERQRLDGGEYARPGSAEPRPVADGSEPPFEVCVVCFQNLKDVLADLIPKEQNRIKSFKQQYGKSNIGQITVDMVGVCVFWWVGSVGTG